MKNRRLEQIIENNILPFVEKPGRYTGNEWNTVDKSAQDGLLRVALAFPEIYEIGMSYIGFEILYHVLNKEAHVWAERVYQPWTDMQQKLLEQNLPLYSLESFTPLNEFDLIGFTLQYELTYTNVLNMLQLGGIPVWASERGERDPIILAGGPCTSNPEPMADFIDAFFIGDGEEAFVEICNAFQQAKKSGKSRKEILVDLAGIRGVYVPQFYEAGYDRYGRFSSIKPVHPAAPERILTRITPDLKAEFYPLNPVIPLIEVTHDRLSVEVMRGCTEGCRFCNAGMIYRPLRQRDEEEILSQIGEGLEKTGYGELSFLSLSISDYSHLNSLMKKTGRKLEGSNINVSFPSMRLDSFSEEIAEFVSSVRKSGFTFAPEAGSERLRQVINKNISEDDLFKSVSIALRNGWKLLKFYFMIGLPTETEEDVEAIADLIERVAQISKQYGRIQFNVAVSPFSPKAHTPFQWERQDTRETFLRKVDILRSRFNRIRSVKFNWRDPDVSLLECVLGRGDRRISLAIYQAWKNGATLDGWSEHFKLAVWLEAFKHAKLSIQRFTEELPLDKPLPWDHIDKGIAASFLVKERENAYAGKPTPDCKDDGCWACGIQRKGKFNDFAECYLPEKARSRSRQAAQFAKALEQSKPALEFTAPATSTGAAEQSIQFRVRYRKVGYARFLSHLDLMRILERACRRAGIPVVYSQGFNPHPKFSFGPPLALGVSSEAEYLDMEVDAGFKGNLANALNLVLPDGLEIVAARPVQVKVAALAAAINVFEYEVDTLAMNKSFASDRQINYIINAAELEVQRKNKDKVATLNIRPFIESIAEKDGRLHIKTKIIDGRTARMVEILQLLANGMVIDERQAKICRLSQLIRQGGVEKTPLEVIG